MLYTLLKFISKISDPQKFRPHTHTHDLRLWCDDWKCIEFGFGTVFVFDRGFLWQILHWSNHNNFGFRNEVPCNFGFMSKIYLRNRLRNHIIPSFHVEFRHWVYLLRINYVLVDNFSTFESILFWLWLLLCDFRFDDYHWK